MHTDLVATVWRMLGHQLDWSGLDVVCEILGVDQPELLIAGLIQLRDHFEEQRRAASSVRH